MQPGRSLTRPAEGAHSIFPFGVDRSSGSVRGFPAKKTTLRDLLGTTVKGKMLGILPCLNLGGHPTPLLALIALLAHFFPHCVPQLHLDPFQIARQQTMKQMLTTLPANRESAGAVGARM